MKHMKKLLFFTILSTFIFFSCEKEELFPEDTINNESVERSKNKVNEAISFLNTNFVSQFNSRAKSLGQKANLDEYSNNTVEVIHELNDEDGVPLLKLICFQPSGYVLISDLEDVPNPPVLFYSQERFDKEDVNPALIKYVEEFLLTHSKDFRAPDDDEDQDGDGSWDDGRDTDGSNDPRDSPYYHKERVLDRWTETIEKGPLLTTAWSQGSPYNNSCPVIDGQNALVGCVAIAVGQIMNYNRKSTKNYDWDKINVMTGTYPSTNHLADFLYDVGKGVNMDYGLDASSSNSFKASLYFTSAGYNPIVCDYNYNVVKKHIDTNKPIYLRGASGRKEVNFIIRWGWNYTGGHAWVGDGYRTVKQMQKVEVDRGNKNGGISYSTRVHSTSEFVHMNWGWGQYYQSISNGGGWCTYNYFKAPGNNGSNFKYKKQMIAY